VQKFLRFTAGLFRRLRSKDVRGRRSCPSRQVLEGFMRGQLDPRENLGVLLHLLPGCPHCQEITAPLWWAGEGVRRGRLGAVTDYEPAVSRVFARVARIHAGLETERADARRLLVELAAVPVSSWGGRLPLEGRTWGLCELLLERSRASAEPRETEALALLAADCAGELSPGSHPAELIADLRARSWIAAAEARRAAGDLDPAEAALRTAGSHLIRGSGERLDKARLVDALAALRCAQGRFQEADRLLRRAIAVYRRTGQVDLLGRAFVLQGYARTCSGDLAGAAVSLRHGLALADATHEPRIALAALYSLACLLHEAGDHRTALSVLGQIAPHWGDGAVRSRLGRLEERIAAAMRPLPPLP
jgi:tetratricopeptide (TPR) repeat protein